MRQALSNKFSLTLLLISFLSFFYFVYISLLLELFLPVTVHSVLNNFFIFTLFPFFFFLGSLRWRTFYSKIFNDGKNTFYVCLFLSVYVIFTPQLVNLIASLDRIIFNSSLLTSKISFIIISFFNSFIIIIPSFIGGIFFSVLAAKRVVFESKRTFIKKLIFYVLFGLSVSIFYKLLTFHLSSEKEMLLLFFITLVMSFFFYISLAGLEFAPMYNKSFIPQNKNYVFYFLCLVVISALSVLPIARVSGFVFEPSGHFVYTFIMAFIADLFLGSLIVIKLFYKVKDFYRFLFSILAIFFIFFFISLNFVDYLFTGIFFLSSILEDHFLLHGLIELLIVMSFVFAPALLVSTVLFLLKTLHVGGDNLNVTVYSFMFFLYSFVFLTSWMITINFLYPLIGLFGVVCLSMFLTFVMLLVFWFLSSYEKKVLITGFFLLLFVLPNIFLFTKNWDRSLMAGAGVINGLGYLKDNGLSVSEETIKINNSILFFNDGPQKSFMVTKDLMGEVYLKEQGASLFSTKRNNMLVNEIISDTGFMYHNNPKDVLLVGLGGGAVLESATSHNVDIIDVVVPYKGIISSLQYFREINKEAILDYRVKVRYQSGLSYLSLSRKKYDIIVTHMEEPWMHGSANYYSKDYYHTLCDRLNNKGLALQFLNIKRIDSESFKHILNDFASVFKHVLLWEADRGKGNYILMGSMDSLVLDYEKIKKRFEIEKSMHEIEEHGFTHVESLLSFMLMDEKTIRHFTWDLEDVDRVYKEFDMAFSDRSPLENVQLEPLYLTDVVKNITDEEMQFLGDNYFAHLLARNARDLFISSKTDIGIELIRQALEYSDTDDVKRQAALALVEASKNKNITIDEKISFLRWAIALNEKLFSAYYWLGEYYFEKGAYAQGIIYFEKAGNLKPQSAEVHLDMALGYEKLGQMENAKTERTFAEKLKTEVLIRQ